MSDVIDRHPREILGNPVLHEAWSVPWAFTKCKGQFEDEPRDTEEEGRK